jgi:small subunit ribosomal protein S2
MKWAIFDVVQTERKLSEALAFIQEIASYNGQILFVGTKKRAAPLVKLYAEMCNMPYVDVRWLGGTFTNNLSIRNSLKQLAQLEDLDQNDAFLGLTKKEILQKRHKLEKLQNTVGGIRKLQGMPSALFVIDTKTEQIAVKEAQQLNIPVIGIVDSNASLQGISYVIPANDDSVKAIEFFLKEATNVILSAQKEKTFKLSENTPKEH